MSKISQQYNQILKYLKDLLSVKERHHLEREMSSDAFGDEAFEGLSMLKGEELELDMNSLNQRIDDRLNKKKNILFTPFWRMAAAIVLISGAAAVLIMLLKTPDPVLITQDKGKLELPPETSAPSVPGSPVATENEPPVGTETGSGITLTSERNIAAATEYKEVDEIVSNKTLEESESPLMQIQTEAAERAERGVSASDSYPDESGYITGRILGVNRKALPGVSIAEEGTGQVTKTDVDGTFRMKVSSPASKIELSYAGYRNMEVTTNEIAGKEISLDEEGRSEQMVILAYNNEELNKALPEAASKTKTQKSSVEPYKRPLPPGGSMKEFEAWVESRIDTMQLKQLLPGNYRIQVRLTVFKDGKIGNISVPDDIPDIASAEYKNAVSMSERWQPAMVGNLPVDSDIVIEFSLTIK